MKKTPRLLTNFLLLSLSMTVGLCLVEAAIRTGIVRCRYATHQKVSGVRDNPKFKIVVLGDSFIAKGRELDKLIVASLRSEGAQFLNLAVGGHGPHHYLKELEKFGLPYKPDVILLSYYVGNDLTDVQYRPYLFQDSSAFGHFSIIAKYKAFAKDIAEKFYTYHFLAERFDTLSQAGKYDWNAMREAGIDESMIRLAQAGKVTPALPNIALKHPNYLLDNVLMETEENMKAWDKIEGILTQINQLSIQVGAELVIVIFPRCIQVDDAHFEFFRKIKLDLDPRTLISDKPQRLLTRFCELRHIKCLDLLPYFKSRKGEPLYLELDDHLNAEGNRYSAQLISDFVMTTVLAQNK